VEDEVAFHLEMRRRELEARGWSPAAARAEAERIFGDVTAITRDCLTIDARRARKRERREEFMRLIHDLRLAARSLRRSPAFTSVALLCFALGIGVAATILSAVNGVLLRALPYPRADELVAIYAAAPERDMHGINISYPDFLSWRDQSHTFTNVGIWTWTSHTLSGEGRGDAEQVYGAGVSPELFPALGVHPMLGRGFAPDEGPVSRARVVLLGHDLWRRRYGGDRAILGQAITIDAQPYTVVGVMPPDFSFPDQGQLWVPFDLDEWGDGRGNRGYAGAIARMKPGVTLEQARADLDVISRQLQQQYPEDNFGWEAEAIPLRDDLVGDLRRPLLVFLGAVGLVLLMACVNVANLLLARGATRRREVAVRVALGAGRRGVVRHVLLESVLLAIGGGVLGALLATQGVRLFRLAFPDGVPFYISLKLDATTLLATSVLAVLVGALAAVIPALRTGHLDVATSLREGGRGDVGGARVGRTRSGLVVAQVALAVIVLIGAMLLVRSYRSLRGTDLGFTTDGVLTARVSLPPGAYDAPERRGQFWTRLFSELAEQPDVEHVGSANGIPFSGWNVKATFSIEGRPAPRRGEELDVHYQWVSPEYFEAIGVPLLRGRMFTRADRDSAVHIGVINETLARQEFPGIDPVGKRLKQGTVDARAPWVTIIGVVGEFRHYRLPEPMGPAIYFPMLAEPAYGQTLAIRTRGDVGEAATRLRATLRAIDPAVPAYQVRSLSEVVTRSLWRPRLQGQVLGVFAVLALVLAAAGIYGVTSYAVAQRAREIGVRMALGATRRRVAGLVVAQAAKLALLGVTIGIAFAAVFARLVGALLHGITATDPVTFLAVPAALAIVAVMASLIPALRAMRVDPAVAMRAE
jgi:predicted permease